MKQRTESGVDLSLPGHANSLGNMRERPHLPRIKLYIIIVFYSICSSMLLLANKYVLHTARTPGFLILCQCSFTAALVPCLSAFGPERQNISLISAKDLNRFSIVVLCFVGTLFANAKALQYVNVDAVIGLRLTIPLFLSFLEFAFLGRELPNVRSVLSLIGIATCFVFYLIYDRDGGISTLAWVWLAIWYSWTIFEGVYVKHVVSTTLLSVVDQTFYQNFLSLPILTLATVCYESSDVIDMIAASWHIKFVLAVSCLLGAGMSFFSFVLRNEVSATMFSLIGNLCKVFTIAANCVVWKMHASPTGTAAIILCIICSTMYAQAPLRKAPDCTARSIGDRGGPQTAL